MHLDLRYPIGLLLTLYGVILAIQGLTAGSESARSERQLVLGHRDDSLRSYFPILCPSQSVIRKWRVMSRGDMHTRTFAALIGVLLLPTLVFAEVTKVNVVSRVTVANGQAFGNTGPYERLTGTIEFAVDPKEPHNARIADIDRAKPGQDQRVHFTSDLMVLSRSIRRRATAYCCSRSSTAETFSC